MLPRADLNINPVGRADGIARLDSVTDPRQEAFHRSMASLLGKSLQGEVISKLTDGSYLVKLAGASARMQLPAGTEVGKQLPLTLISLSPRPTFELATQAGPAALLHAEPAEAEARPARAPQPDALLPGKAGSQPATHSLLHAASLLGKAPLTPAGQLPAIDPGSTPATLSDTARAISGVLTLALSSATAHDTVVARLPLTAAPGAAPPELAGALRDAVAKSGLFYESHVAEWSSGARTLAELAGEPQMQRAQGAASADPALRHPASDPATAQLINLQLQTQEQARVVWQGQPWPGQDMRWEIARDAPDGQGRGEAGDDEPGWNSTLRLRFARLGEIGARLTMVGDQIHLQLDAGTDAVGELLRAHAGALDTAMQAAGTALSSLTIRTAPEPERG